MNEVHESCDGCKHDLGGCRDNCRLNLSYECRDGGGFEAWEATGEYINANTCMNLMRNYMDFECPVDAIDSVDALIGKIGRLDKVDAEPVRHGRWLVVDSLDIWDTYHCSRCNSVYFSRHNYCPNCGAKMDAR